MDHVNKYTIDILLTTNDFYKERYYVYVKSCNSILYTKTYSANYIGSILGNMCCL